MSYPSGTDQMRLPIGAGQICKPDRVSCVVHPVIAHINPNVRDIIAAVIRPLKEHQIAGLGVPERDVPGHVILRLCGARQRDTRHAITPLRQAGAVKGCCRGRTAVDIFPALVFQCFIHDRIYGLVIKLCGIQILRYQPDIEHIAVVVAPAAVFRDGYFILVGNTHLSSANACASSKLYLPPCDAT